MPRTTTAPAFETIADLLHQLGGIPPERVRFRPVPGTATERDVIEFKRREGRYCELVDGVLVEKAMGFRESIWACALIGFLEGFLKRHDLGLVAGEQAAMRLMPGLIRIPDVSFISWDRIPDRNGLNEPIPGLAPDLAVEVLSKSNTRREMERKLREYFHVGVRLVWYADPKVPSVRVYRSPSRSVLVGIGGTLDGGDVLPGFALPLRDWFAWAERTGPGGG